MLRAKRVDRPLSPRAQASRLIAALAAFFADCVVLEQVRSAPGLSDVFRFADALAVYVGAEGWKVHGIEAKRTRQDWTRELNDPEKSAPFRLFCAQWSLVVPAPWKHVVLTLDELPDRWGLIEVDGGTARTVIHAMDKVLPRAIACLACAAELPPDVELLEAAVQDLDGPELDRLAAAFDARRAARGAA